MLITPRPTRCRKPNPSLLYSLLAHGGLSWGVPPRHNSACHRPHRNTRGYGRYVIASAQGISECRLAQTVTDQKFNAPGGCTNERTIEGSNADAYKLAELH